MGVFVLVVVLAVLFIQNFLPPRVVFLGSGRSMERDHSVSLYSTGCARTFYIDKAGLEHLDICLPLLWSAGIKGPEISLPAQAGFKLKREVQLGVIWSPPLKCWDYRCAQSPGF